MTKWPAETEADAGAEPDQPVNRIVWEVRRGPLLVHAALTLVAVGFAMRVNLPLPPVLGEQWPLVLMIGGGALLVVGLVAAWAAGALLGPLLVALGGMGALAPQQMHPANPGLIGGALLVALAVALLLRGVSFARR